VTELAPELIPVPSFCFSFFFSFLSFFLFFVSVHSTLFDHFPSEMLFPAEDHKRGGSYMSYIVLFRKKKGKKEKKEKRAEAHNKHHQCPFPSNESLVFVFSPFLFLYPFSFFLFFAILVRDVWSMQTLSHRGSQQYCCCPTNSSCVHRRSLFYEAQNE